MNQELVIRNRKVIEFYDTHKNINFEEMNVVLVDILNKLLVETSTTLDSEFVTKILGSVSKLNMNIESMETRTTQMHVENVNTLSLKLAEFRKEYVQDMKMILSDNNSEKIKPLLKEYNEILQDKTKILINEIIPLSNEKISKEINESFKEIKEITSKDYGEQGSINKNIQELLRKFENSSSKGGFSEILITNILRDAYGSAEINNIGSITKESGDIVLARRDKPTIIIENKDYGSKNIPQDQIDKFIRDLKIQNCSGIMLSQRSSIVFRNDFEIAFYENKIAIFVEKVNYDINKIKIAINLIDQLSDIIDQTTLNPEFINIDNETLANINKEVNSFINQKLTLINSMKEFSIKHIKDLESINLNTLTGILEVHFGSNKPINSICDICNVFSAKNAKSMSKHKQTCLKKHQIN